MNKRMSIENLVNKGVLKAHRIGGRVLLNIEELDTAVQGGQSHGSIVNRNEK
jgi:excisionase family DNA binding protein